MAAKFERPAWLGPTPQANFKAYGDDWNGTAWYSIPPDEHYTQSQSCYATHTLALKGNPACLEIMRRYYLALVTKRIKR